MTEFTVFGIPIHPWIQEKLIATMQKGPFREEKIEKEAVRLGVPIFLESGQWFSRRTARLLICRERRCGNLSFEASRWHWIGPRSETGQTGVECHAQAAHLATKVCHD